MIFYDKKVIIKRYSSALGALNRPKTVLNDVGCYECTYKQEDNSTAQLQPQKSNSAEYTLYLDETVDIRLGDICYLYEVDEYGNIILSSERVLVADKPYKKRDHLEVLLNNSEEV